jgi:valyl-tRNA synthetase
MTQFEFENPQFKNATIEAQYHDFQVMIGAVREIRSSRNIPFDQPIPITTGCDQETADVLSTMVSSFNHMANVIPSAWGPNVTAPPLSMTRVVQGARGPIEVHADVSRFIDVAAERKRLEKQRDELTKFAKSITGKLSNKGFLDKAPAEVVEQQRAKLAEVEGQLASIEAALKKLFD